MKEGNLVVWKKIETILKEKGMTRYRLSKLTGIPETTLINIKVGKSKHPSFYMIYKIAKALEVDLEELVPDEWKETE